MPQAPAWLVAVPLALVMSVGVIYQNSGTPLTPNGPGVQTVTMLDRRPTGRLSRVLPAANPLPPATGLLLAATTPAAAQVGGDDAFGWVRNGGMRSSAATPASPDDLLLAATAPATARADGDDAIDGVGNGGILSSVAAPASPEPPAVVFAGTGKELEIGKLGCSVPKGNIARVGLAASPGACAELCYQQGYPFLGLGLGLEDNVCWCVDDASGMVKLGGPSEGSTDVECTFKQAAVFKINTPALEIIDLYVAPAKRTSSMFTSGRLDQYYSGKYAYRKKGLNARVFKSREQFSELMCTDRKKILVQIAGSVTTLLQQWPNNAVLIMTADEIGNWGLGKEDRRFGPHGKGKEFGTNETSEYKHILLPEEVFPMYRQYYHYRQIAAHGSDRMRFVPLGSRNEFPHVPKASIVPASERKYIYSYMASITDGTRAKVHRLLLNDTRIPASNRYMQIAQNWHPNANNEEYVAPMQYSEVMMQSAFAICPKGHSVEQFRIYEAIESGSIPVMDLKDGYLSQHLPPAYMDSPMLLLTDGWDSVVDEMQRLWDNPAELRRRQQALIKWYDDYMKGMMSEIEGVLESRADKPPTPFCKGMSSTATGKG